MRARGALTIAQSEESSAVFGMPRAAIAAGAVVLTLRVDHIAPTVVAVAAGSLPSRNFVAKGAP
jgi:chemotaxis response regulator CheB